MKIVKKDYIAPVSSFVEIETLSLLIAVSDGQIDPDDDEEGQLSNEYNGGDWNNIWNM